MTTKYVYLLVNEIGRYKIGISGEVEKRCKTLSYSGGIEIGVVHKWITPCASTFEEFLHTFYCEYHHLGEWFSLTTNPKDEITTLHQKFIMAYDSTCKTRNDCMQGWEVSRKLHHLLPIGAISHKRSKRVAEAAKLNDSDT